MEDLVLEGGRTPCAADFEDLGSEIFTMIQRHQSRRPAGAYHDEIQAERQTKQVEQLPKQAIRVLYGVLGLAVGTLAWLWSRMF